VKVEDHPMPLHGEEALGDGDRLRVDGRRVAEVWWQPLDKRLELEGKRRRGQTSADGAAGESLYVAADDDVAEAAGGVIAAAGPATMVGSIVAATTEARPR
jgi:hypothetical protein